jgi:hypothetical protein
MPPATFRDCQQEPLVTPSTSGATLRAHAKMHLAGCLPAAPPYLFVQKMHLAGCLQCYHRMQLLLAHYSTQCTPQHNARHPQLSHRIRHAGHQPEQRYKKNDVPPGPTTTRHRCAMLPSSVCRAPAKPAIRQHDVPSVPTTTLVTDVQGCYQVQLLPGLLP